MNGFRDRSIVSFICIEQIRKSLIIETNNKEKKGTRELVPKYKSASKSTYSFRREKARKSEEAVFLPLMNVSKNAFAGVIGGSIGALDTKINEFRLFWEHRLPK